MVENQFRFNQQLANYFANNASSHICDKCSMLISRQIKISDCSAVIILKVNDIKNSTNLSSKPPPAQSQTESPHIYATPLIREGYLDLNCSICNERTENIILPITHQVHHQCSSFTMYHLSCTTFNSVMNLRVELTEYKQKKHLYKPSTVLLIDEYNSLATNTNSIDENNASLLCTPKISMSQQ
ncbi:unnamed protein product, partial [Rotaria magnacalcarata]